MSVEQVRQQVAQATEQAREAVAARFQILVPMGAEIPIGDVLDAADEYARTGQRPTCVQWESYVDKMDRTHSAV